MKETKRSNIILIGGTAKMATNAKDGAFGDLSTEEMRMLDAAVKKCAT